MDHVKVFYGVDWIVEKYAPREREMKYLRRKKQVVELAEALRKKTGNFAKMILSGNVEELSFVHSKRFIITTPPRPYNQWKYECAKSDIVVVGPMKKRELCVQRFEKEKRKALLEKEMAKQYIRMVKPILERLYSNGLIEGVLGRGSYFDKNGFPVPHDDIDFILMRRKMWSKKEMTKLIDSFRKVKTIRISFVMSSDRQVNKVKKGKMASFFAGSKYHARRAGGIPYDRYVLVKSVGIPLKWVTAEKSERLAEELARYLPKRDMRKEHKTPRLPPKKVLDSKKIKL